MVQEAGRGQSRGSPPPPTYGHIYELAVGGRVYVTVGEDVGWGVGDGVAVGEDVGEEDGVTVGEDVGEEDGVTVGEDVGVEVGEGVGEGRVDRSDLEDLTDPPDLGRLGPLRPFGPLGRLFPLGPLGPLNTLLFLGSWNRAEAGESLPAPLRWRSMAAAGAVRSEARTRTRTGSAPLYLAMVTLGFSLCCGGMVEAISPASAGRWAAKDGGGTMGGVSARRSPK